MNTVFIQSTIKAPVEKVWNCFTQPEHISQWNQADPSWHCPAAENDLKENGKFNYRMEARDGSFGFDFFGVYDKVIENDSIDYTLGDGRKVKVRFIKQDGDTIITQEFEPEGTNPVDFQKSGWQAILDNFARYCSAKN